jgi:hypothetical protein
MRRHSRSFAHLLLALPLCMMLVTPAEGAKSTAYRTAFMRWRASEGQFSDWTLNGVALVDGTLQFDPLAATPGTDPYPPGGYNGRNFYNGGSFKVGEATSPIVPTSFNFTEAIASWNATTPAGSWIETLISAEVGGRWTKWFNLGVWAADGLTVQRHSVNLQGDADGFVAVDTLVLSGKKILATAYQIKVRLFSATGAAIPSVHNLSVAISTTPAKPNTLMPGNPNNWGTTLNVPECSQMVYADGGEVWCSPTSTSMVLAYWENYTGPCELRVRAAVEGVFDWIYDGHGNWPFNAAYAATHNLEGYVARFTSMAQVEPWIAAGVPVVISYAWKKSSLDGAPIPSSSGHLAVLVGFDAAGNPIVNDPAAANDSDVQRTYNRAQLETVWLESSGGTVYLIYPPNHPVPSL